MKRAIFLQYIAPKELLTIVAGKLASLPCGALTSIVIQWFVKRYQVNMQEAVNPDVNSYKTFNAFFTRPLQPSARAITKANFNCPVDGEISQFGSIKQDQIFQAKGHHYSTLALLAGNSSLAKKFDDGSFACLYLSPKDYHRIHMPCAGILKSMTYVPGDLFSVNPTTAEHIPKLFARNERVVCEFFSKAHGTFVIVLVGATIVGSIATVWHGVVSPPRSKKVRTWQYNDHQIHLLQGAEMGRFLLGSTVVVLFEKEALSFNEKWQPSGKIKLGEAMSRAAA